MSAKLLAFHYDMKRAMWSAAILEAAAKGPAASPGKEVGDHG